MSERQHDSSTHAPDADERNRFYFPSDQLRLDVIRQVAPKLRRFPELQILVGRQLFAPLGLNGEFPLLTTVEDEQDFYFRLATISVVLSPTMSAWDILVDIEDEFRVYSVMDALIVRSLVVEDDHIRMSLWTEREVTDDELDRMPLGDDDEQRDERSDR